MSFDLQKTAGDDVESRCLKCKAVTNHTIIAMTGDAIIAKVECRSCGGRHNYRAPVPKKKGPATTLRRRNGAIILDSQGMPKAAATTGGRKLSRGAVNFEALLKDRDVSTATPYAVNTTLTAGGLVNHSTFGLGVVTAIMPPNKAQVTFREHGPKLLICRLG